MYEKLWDFQNLYKAYRKARKGKRYSGAAAAFELNLSENISRLSDELKNGTYSFSPYYSFEVTDPKRRVIHALHFKDRLLKERLGIKWYVRYMDDGVLIHNDREYLKECLADMETIASKLGLELNEKTQIVPLSRGIGFLGFHFYLTDTGKVIRKLRPQAKKRYMQKLRDMQKGYMQGNMELDYISQVVQSYHAHLSHGNCSKLEKRCLKDFVLTRDT